ncbi:phage protein [Staphylococcus aureus]|nr:phage protein [Staphylococcus aureus]CAC5917632.1 phage protein [Staphylococcus aureus]
MKIKVKKEMTLDELIKWAWKNPELVRGEKFYPQGKRDETCVYFRLDDGRRCLMRGFISADDTFAVEYEEEVTEETVIPKLVKMYEDGKMSVYNDYSIKRSLLYSPKAYYILNDDLTMTLIWKDGELVE